MEDKNKLYTYEYPRPAVTTDCVVFGYDLKGGLSVLLIERGADPYNLSRDTGLFLVDS